MYNATISLFILGGAALIGLQGALGLAVRHHLFRNRSRQSTCDRLLSTPQAYLGPIPVAFFAAAYFALVLLLLMRLLVGEENPMDLLTFLILISIPFTCYYAWLLLYKLRIFCMGCIQIYIANAIMIASCIAYYKFL